MARFRWKKCSFVNFNFPCFYFPECDNALGMQDRTIPDLAITASSAYGGNLAKAAFARLHGTLSWPADRLEVGEWLQVDLGKIMIVTKVATQGMAYGPFLKWVTKYKISGSMNQQSWQHYTENGIVKVNGNL